MSEPFIGEIRMFGGNFAPRGWAYCDGQLVAVSQNDALFSLFGTMYGGDGRTTFGLPDLRGRVPIHAGTGPGLTARDQGSKAGVESVTLNSHQIPVHTHTVFAASDPGVASDPSGSLVAERTTGDLYVEAAPDVTLAAAAVESHTTTSHNNLMAFQTVAYIVALSGIFPSRT